MSNANDESMSIASALIASLFDAIKHGDEKHQAWLRGAIDSHFRVCRCGHPEFEHGGPQMDCGHELDGDFCGCVHFALAASPALQPAPVAPVPTVVCYGPDPCIDHTRCEQFAKGVCHLAAPQLSVPAEPRACRRCSECQGAQHHWIPNDAPDYACKHCDVGYAWMCIGCDEPLGDPDAMCAACSNEGDDGRSEA